jgi:hypothetical protein
MAVTDKRVVFLLFSCCLPVVFLLSSILLQHVQDTTVMDDYADEESNQEFSIRLRNLIGGTPAHGGASALHRGTGSSNRTTAQGSTGLKVRRGSSSLSIHVHDSARKSPTSTSPGAGLRVSANAVHWATRTRKLSATRKTIQEAEQQAHSQAKSPSNAPVNATNTTANPGGNDGVDKIDGDSLEHPDSSDRRKRR